MKAILVDEKKNLVWSDVPDPIIAEDEVLVKIHAAALNRADLLQRQGKYPSPAGCPEWMGLEIAGTIEKIGDGVPADFKMKVGDKICALLGGGGYAECGDGNRQNAECRHGKNHDNQGQVEMRA